MGERISVNPAEVRTTRLQPLVREKLDALDPIFQEGRQDDLDPVVFVRRHPTGEPIFCDGHHRLKKAAEYGVSIPGEILSVGERYRDFRGEENRIYELSAAIAEASQQVAHSHGLGTIDAYGEPVEEAEMSRELAQEEFVRLRHELNRLI